MQAAPKVHCRVPLAATDEGQCKAAVMSTETEYGDFPLKRFLGMEIEEVAPGQARAVITVVEEHLNPNGVVHGAVLAAMVDTAMGKATMSVLPEGRFCATVDLQLRFIRPAASGVLAAEASVLKAGRSVVHLEARVLDDSDRLVATAAGTFSVVSPEAGV